VALDRRGCPRRTRDSSGRRCSHCMVAAPRTARVGGWRRRTFDRPAKRWASSYPRPLDTLSRRSSTAPLRRPTSSCATVPAHAGWLLRINCRVVHSGRQGRLHPGRAVPFNTGQILMGLAAGVAEFGAYRRGIQAGGGLAGRSAGPDGCCVSSSRPLQQVATRPTTHIFALAACLRRRASSRTVVCGGARPTCVGP